MSTATKKPVDATKARAIASRLASDHDGEVLNAAKALVRLAVAAGIRVEDLIAPAPPMNRPTSSRSTAAEQAAATRAREAAEAFRRATNGFAYTDFTTAFRRPGQYDRYFINWSSLMPQVNTELAKGPNHPIMNEQERLLLIKAYNTYIMFNQAPEFGEERDRIIDLLSRLGILGKL